jgi:glucose/arabinose dehydrogenase
MSGARRHKSALLIATVLMAACSPQGTSGTMTSLPADTTTPGATGPNAEVTYSVTLIGSLPGAVDLVERSADDAFFYVVSRTGTIERWRRDGTRIDEVLDIGSATEASGERGLLGLAFRRVEGAWSAYINFTDTNGDTVVSRFEVAADGSFIGSGTGTGVLTIDQPYSNHNGGGLAVGPDNMLYVGMGDGGSANDPGRVSLDNSSLLGKMLRIDPLPTGGYRVPADNPFAGPGTGARGEIWSNGLRNPWRFSFDTQGNLWVADVGQGEREEVSVAAADGATPGGRGVSFGWSAWEGSRRFNTDVESPAALMPVHEYEHVGGACSISGGAVGTNTTTPSRAGWYFYGDYCTGKVMAILTDGARTVLTETVAEGLSEIVAVRATSAAMYVVSLSGEVHEIRSVRR